MNRWRRSTAALVLTAVVASIGACGSTAPVDSGGKGRSTVANARKGVKFARCMRSNGVGEFPDPPASGQLTIDGIANGSSLDTSTPTFERAISTCKDLEPAGFTGSRRSPQQMQAALEFARCIRENGVKDFPDPADGQPLVDTNRIPSSATESGMSILNAAMQKCRGFVAAQVGGQR